MRDICIAISSIRNSIAAGFYDKCIAVRALRVYLRPRFSLHRTENDNITLRPLKCRYHSDMEFSVQPYTHPLNIILVCFSHLLLALYNKQQRSRKNHNHQFFFRHMLCNSVLP